MHGVTKILRQALLWFSFTGVLISSSGFLALPTVDGSPKATPPSDQAQSPNKVIFSLQNRLLNDVLAEISEKSGIKIFGNMEILNEPLSGTLEVDDWHTALNFLLEDFNRIEMFGAESLSSVRILSRKETGSSIVSPVSAGRPPAHPASVATIIPSPHSQPSAGGATMPDGTVYPPLYFKLKRLTSLKPEKMISGNLLSDPELRIFLNHHGIQSAKDFNSANKVRVVKRMAFKKLETMEAVAQLKRRTQMKK